MRWGEGGFAIFADDGTLLFALSHEEQWEAYEDQEPDEWYETEQILLRHDGTGWVSIALPDQLGPDSWFTGLVVEDDRVVLAALVEDPAAHEWRQVLKVLIGTD